MASDFHWRGVEAIQCSSTVTDVDVPVLSKALVGALEHRFERRECGPSDRYQITASLAPINGYSLSCPRCCSQISITTTSTRNAASVHDIHGGISNCGSSTHALLDAVLAQYLSVAAVSGQLLPMVDRAALGTSSRAALCDLIFPSCALSTTHSTTNGDQSAFRFLSASTLQSRSTLLPTANSHSPHFIGLHYFDARRRSASVREMSKPENNVAALNWRRLHLSRAKLKASSRTSALLSGFAMVAMVEINLAQDIPEPLLIAFCVCTTLLVSVHMLALMISTCILPNLEAVASIHGIVAVNESPHEKMHLYIEAAWGFSTVFGILLFMAEIAIICWVVFIKISYKAALAGTIILIPMVMVFTAFALHFYRNLVAHKFERSAQTVQELEDMVSQLQAGPGHPPGQTHQQQQGQQQPQQQHHSQHHHQEHHSPQSAQSRRWGAAINPQVLHV